jgi:hypothetical protein
MCTERTYQEIVEELDDMANYELVVQTARNGQVGEDDVHLSVVTVDGVTRGVISRHSMTDALDQAATLVVAAAEEEDLDEDLDDEELDDDELDEETAFDRVVEALESAATLLRRIRR